MALASMQDINSAPKEMGLPLVNSIGQLSGMALTTNTVAISQDIEKLLQSVDALKNPPTNVVHDDWNNGITAYYKGIASNDASKQLDLTTAQHDFTDAFQKNSQFQGAQAFAQAAQSALQSNSASNSKTTSSSGAGTLSSLEDQKVDGVSLWLISVVGLLLLIAIVIVVGLIFSRSRARKRRLQDEFVEANRQGMLEEQRIALEEQRIAKSAVAPPPSTTPSLSGSVHPPTQVKMPPIDIQQVRCPTCGVHVSKGATTCPNCRQSLVPIQPTSPQSDQSFRQPEKPVVAVDPLRTSPFTSPILEASIMKEPVQQRRPDPVPPDPVKMPAVSKVPVQAIYSPSKEAERTGRIGQRLGNYRLVRVLGHGGFAEVYLGEHVFLKTQAAIKVLHTRLTREALVGFLNEARTIAELVHPHIVRVLEFGVEGDEPDLDASVFDAAVCTPYLIMDYASGGTLRKRHPKGTRLPLTTILPYVRQVADALQYAHDKRLIHRDIKPENMLVGHNNEVLLSDFGIAAVAHSERSMSTQEMAGTVPYMAPEQIRGKPRPASDQYALAIVIYEWLCGSRPFQGSQWEIIDQHMSVFPAPMYKKGVPVSPHVEAVVMKALAKDSLQRFDSMQAFVRAFEQASLSR
jgi:tRNA A-37 threonylcarbamoyl transferase component Bud32